MNKWPHSTFEVGAALFMNRVHEQRERGGKFWGEGSKRRGDHERIMRRSWENHENIDGSGSRKKGLAANRGRGGSRGGKGGRNRMRKKKLKKSKGREKENSEEREGSKRIGDHERFMRRSWENHENIDESGSQKKRAGCKHVSDWWIRIQVLLC